MKRIWNRLFNIYSIRYKVAMPIYGGSWRDTRTMEINIKAMSRKHALKKLHKHVINNVYELIYYVHDENDSTHNNASN